MVYFHMFLARGKRVFGGARVFWVVLVSVMVMGVGSVPCWAGSVYSVSHISVDISADTAIQAREEALEEGRRRAFQILLRRLTHPSDWSRLPVLSDERIRAFVRRFEVFREKRSHIRYLARITVHFDPEAVALLLSDMKIPFSDIQHRPFLLFPVYEESGMPTPEDPDTWLNPWYEALLDIDLENAPVPFVLLSPQDTARLSVEDIGGFEPQDMEALARAYGAQEVMIAHLHRASHWVRLIVRQPRKSSALSSKEEGVVFDLVLSETTFGAQEGDVLMKKAAEALVESFSLSWRNQSMVTIEEKGKLRFVVRFRSLEEWLGIRDRLERLSLVERYEIRGFGPGDAVVDVYFRGTSDELRLSAEFLGLQIDQQDEEESWLMYLRSEN